MKITLVFGFFGNSYSLLPGNLQLENLDNWVSSPELGALTFPPEDPLSTETGALRVAARLGSLDMAHTSAPAPLEHFNKDMFTEDLLQTLSSWFIQTSVWALGKATATWRVRLSGSASTVGTRRSPLICSDRSLHSKPGADPTNLPGHISKLRMKGALPICTTFQRPCGGGKLA